MLSRIRLVLVAAALPAALSAVAQDDLGGARERVAREEQRRTETLERAARAVVCIFADTAKGGGGSGVVISPEGYGLTNFHVVQMFIETRRGVGGLSDGKLYPLRVLGVDPGGDVALFRLEGRERFDYAPLGDSDSLVVGQWVAALGNPFVLAEDFSPTITLGPVSGLRRYQQGEGNILEYADCIQVATSINPGNSGGPLFDLAGRVVGINGRISIEERGRVNVGLGYAISIKQIKRFIPSLRAGRLVEHGTLGAVVQQQGDEVVISAIQDLSPAERGGMQLGDVIVRVADREIRTPNDYNNIVATLPAEWPVEIAYRRDGVQRTALVRTERLALRMPMAYVPDLESNLAELRTVLARFDERAGRTSARSGVLVARGRVRIGDGAGAGLSFRCETDGIEGATPRIEWLAGAAPPGDLSRDVREWLAALGVLLTPRDLGLGWEFLGGDEVLGQICNVAQRRFAGGSRLRWKFAADSADLLGLALADQAGVETLAWQVDGVLDPRVGGVAARWVRHDESGADDGMTRIELDSLEWTASAPAASAPARSEDRP